MRLSSTDKILLIFKSIALIFVALAIVGAIKAYSPVPYWDMWNGYLDFYVKVTGGDWMAWWAQHNEHRIVLARLLFWLDIRFFGGQSLFLIVVTYVLICLSCLIFLKISKNSIFVNNKWIAYFLIAWLFSWSQEENLTWGFQSQFILAQLLPLSSFYFMHRAVENADENLDFYLAILFGVLSLGTMANGVLTLPLLAVYAVLSRMTRARIVFLLILSILTTLLYFYDFKFPEQHGSLIQALRYRPLQFFQYVALYFGSPFFYIFGKGAVAKCIAMLAGVFIIASSILFVKRILPIAHKDSLSLSLLIFIAYVGGTSIGTAGGRLIFGLDQALSSRYVTPVLMAWAALLILYSKKSVRASWFFGENVWKTFLLFLVLMLPQQLKALHAQRELIFEREVGALALNFGVKDQVQIGNIFPSVDIALSIVEIPKVMNLSIFGEFPFAFKELREDVSKKNEQVSNKKYQCLGSVDAIEPIEGDPRYLSVRGWLFDPIEKSTSKIIRFIDEAGVMAGAGLTGRSRPDVAAAIDSAADRSGFKGYILSSAQGKEITITSADKDCQFMAIVPIIFFSSSKVTQSSLISVTASKIEENEWVGSDFYHTSIPSMSILGSWIESDQDKGSLVLRLRRGDSFLYRSGPKGGHQVVEVLETPYLKSLLPVATEWVRLDFSSALLPDEFNIKLSDQGSEWGEWSAIAVKLKVN